MLSKRQAAGRTAFLPYLRFLTLLTGLAITVPSHAQYYVSDGDGLRSASGDPATVSAKSWEVRLYKKTASTGGKDHWGLISGKSAPEVMERLKQSQANEQTWERWCGCDWGEFTYSNPLGPIAVMDSRVPPNSSALVERLTSIYSQMRQLNAFLRKLDLAISDKVRTNPFKSVGKVLEDYAQLLRKTFQDLGQLQKAIASNEVSLAQTMSQLDKVERGLRQLEQSGPKVSASLGRLPGSRASSGQLYDGRDGDRRVTVTLETENRFQTVVIRTLDPDGSTRSVERIGPDITKNVSLYCTDECRINFTMCFSGDKMCEGREVKTQERATAEAVVAEFKRLAPQAKYSIR